MFWPGHINKLNYFIKGIVKHTYITNFRSVWIEIWTFQHFLKLWFYLFYVASSFKFSPNREQSCINEGYIIISKIIVESCSFSLEGILENNRYYPLLQYFEGQRWLS